jgi:hypothetical protein
VQRRRLIDDLLVGPFRRSAADQESFIQLDEGLSVVSKHARTDENARRQLDAAFESTRVTPRDWEILLNTRGCYYSAGVRGASPGRTGSGRAVLPNRLKRRARWLTGGVGGLPFEISRSMRTCCSG